MTVKAPVHKQLAHPSIFQSSSKRHGVPKEVQDGRPADPPVSRVRRVRLVIVARILAKALVEARVRPTMAHAHVHVHAEAHALHAHTLVHAVTHAGGPEALRHALTAAH